MVATADVVAIDAAKQTCRRYHGYVDFDDVIQEHRVWMLKHPAKLDEWLDREDEDEFRKGRGALFVTLSRRGERHARAEKARLCGYEISDEWFISSKLIEEELPAVIAGDSLWHETVQSEGRNYSDPAEGGNRAAIRADVAAAWAKYPDPVLAALVHGETAQDVADDLGVSVTTIRRRKQRALDRMIRFLGGESPWH